jgi:hypothetical protein
MPSTEAAAELATSIAVDGLSPQKALEKLKAHHWLARERESLASPQRRFLAAFDSEDGST